MIAGPVPPEFIFWNAQREMLMFHVKHLSPPVKEYHLDYSTVKVDCPMSEQV
jgi:hypothetical protein